MAKQEPNLLKVENDSAYEQQFIKAHRKHSFFSSLYFAVAGASFIGVLGTLCNRVWQVMEEGGKMFKNPKTPTVMSALMAVGVGFTYLSNKRETEKVRLEDMRLARRFAIDKPEHAAEPPARADGKSWAETVDKEQRQAALQR